MPSTIEIKCTECTNINCRRISWISPAQFTNPEEASLVSSFHCAFCSAGNAMKIKFLENQQVELVEIVDFAKIIENSRISFEPAPEDNPLEVLAEDSALTLLNDVD